MIESFPDPKELYIDLPSGKVLLGNSAAEQHLNSVCAVKRILPITQILEPEFPISELPTNEGHPGKIKWSKEQVKAYGQWVMGLSDETLSQGYRKPTRDVVEKLWHLNLGPNLSVVSNRFGSLSNFQRELGFVGERSRGAFSHWTTHDFIAYIQQAGEELGHKPNEHDLSKRFHRGDGPSLKLIEQHGLRKLHDRAGYVSSYGQEPKYFTTWGVRFMVANNGAPIMHKHISSLSPLGLAPSNKSIAKHFGGVPNYREEVQTQYEKWLELRKLNRRTNLCVARQLSIHGALQFESSDADTVLAQAARFRVAKHLLPGRIGRDYRLIANSGASSMSEFVRVIMQEDRSIGVFDIEAAATELGVIDDLWPPEDRFANLRLTTTV